jgi:hypothetical protein
VEKVIIGDVIGNLIVNAGLLAAVGYLAKRYIDKNDESIEMINTTIKENRIAAIIDNQEKHDDLKERIQSNREFYTDTYKDLKKDIENVAALQRIANGRTGKLEMNVHDLDTSVRTQVNLCKQRNEKDACNGHT